MAEFFRTVDVMSKYPNTLGLLAANETVNNKDSEKAIPVVKAVVRDLKRYMGMKHEVSGQRVIPIGYNAAANDGRENAVLDYLSLGDAASTIDFWTVSTISSSKSVHLLSSPQCKGFMWSGNSSMEISGYSMLVAQLQNAAIPIFISEYGTNLHQPRMFQETAALYSPQMSQVFSGGCAYEFWQSSNGYGLVELLDKEGAPITPGSISLAKNQKTRARKNGMSKTAEKRETDRGTLFIYQDFVNYKANLEATRGIEGNWEGDIMEREAEGRANVDTAQRIWPWGPEFGVPESCVDWTRLEESLRGEGLLYVM
ncbi:hypothetical protein N0V94_001109 [Neodidymelliopsis sp. IMI 364377]|nr:hypothetical protein N0V94_001109 [Neodidymelliopsis sp. IMI 364377]